MFNRRESLKLFASSFLLPVVEKLSFGWTPKPAANSAGTGCTSCDEEQAIQNLRKRSSRILDSASLLSRASLPPALVATIRSQSDGIPIEYVDSATGSLSFAILDVSIESVPSIAGIRFYSSSNSHDIGLGIGWSLDLDERFVHINEGASLYSGSGGVTQLRMAADSSLQTIHPHLSRIQPITLASDGTYIEKRLGVSRIYSEIGGAYHLTALDYGELGRINIGKDTSGHIQTITHAASGSSISFRWSEGETPRVESIIDGTGRSVSFSYLENRLIGMTDVTGAKWRYSYSATGLLTAVFDPLNTPRLQAEYAGTKVVTLMTPQGRFVLSYPGEQGILVLTDANDKTSRFTHNALGQLERVESDGGSQYTTISYDSLNRIETIATAADATRRYGYDSQDRLVSFAYGSNSLQQAFDAAGRLLEEQSAKYKTVYTYDANGNPVRANSTSRKRSYIATYTKGRVTSLISNRRNLSFEHDGLGKTTAIIEHKAGRYGYGRNQRGWLINQQLPEGYTKNIERDLRGQITAWKDSSGRSFKYVRDARGALTEVQSSTGDWVKAERDALGRITQLINSKGQSRSFAYNAMSRLTEYRDATGRQFNFLFDATGKATSMVQKDGNLTVVRGKRGQDVAKRRHEEPHLVLASAPVGRTALKSEPYNDGWLDPLGFGGLLGSIADNSAISMVTPLHPAGDLPDGEPSDGDGDGDGDGPPNSDGGGGGGEGDGDGDGDGDGSDACQSCRSDYQSTCTNTKDDCESSAQTTYAAAVALCTATIEAPPLWAACVAAASLIYNSALNTCTTNYNNCVTLIPENCYSQCNPN